MTREAEVVTRFFATVLGPEHRISEATDYLAANFVDHSSADSDAGPQGVVAKLDSLWHALPEGRYEIEQIVAAGQMVAVRSRLVGGRVPVDFADFYRVEDDLITEHWHVVDAGTLANALQ